MKFLRGGTTLKPLRKCWNKLFLNWLSELENEHHFLLQNRLILIKWGCLQKNWVKKVKIWPSYELFYYDTIFLRIMIFFFKLPFIPLFFTKDFDIWCISPFYWYLYPKVDIYVIICQHNMKVKMIDYLKQRNLDIYQNTGNI